MFSGAPKYPGALSALATGVRTLRITGRRSGTRGAGAVPTTPTITTMPTVSTDGTAPLGTIVSFHAHPTTKR